MNLGFADTLGLIVRTLRKHWKSCALAVAPYALAVGLADGLSKSLTLDVGPSSLAVSEVAVTGIAIFVALAVFVALNVLVYPMTVGALSLIGSAEVYGDAVDGRGIRRQVMEHGVDAIAAFLLTTIILAVAPVALGLLAAVVAAMASALTAFAILTFALVVLIVPEIFVAVRLSMVVPVVIREGLKPKQALRRSWELVAGARWLWVFAVGVVTIVAAVAGYLVVEEIARVLHASGFLKFVVYFVAGAIETGIAIALVGSATGVVYGSLAAEDVHAPAELVAHEVLPSELPPLPST